jgi:hypothetical protein
MNPVDRRAFLRSMAQGAVWVAPTVVTLSTPRGLEAQATATTKGSGMGAKGKGMGKGKDGNFLRGPAGPTGGTPPPWERRPPRGDGTVR